MGDLALELALSGRNDNGDGWTQCLKGSLGDEIATILGVGEYSTGDKHRLFKRSYRHCASLR